jgi:hypothetical protein
MIALAAGLGALNAAPATASSRGDLRVGGAVAAPATYSLRQL